VRRGALAGRNGSVPGQFTPGGRVPGRRRTWARRFWSTCCRSARRAFRRHCASTNCGSRRDPRLRLSSRRLRAASCCLVRVMFVPANVRRLSTLTRQTAWSMGGAPFHASSDATHVRHQLKSARCDRGQRDSSAAIVMVVVFAIFATLRSADPKELGVGLVSAVLINATYAPYCCPRRWSYSATGTGTSRAGCGGSPRSPPRARPSKQRLALPAWPRDPSPRRTGRRSSSGTRASTDAPGRHVRPRAR
jgi:hypothetical protein